MAVDCKINVVLGFSENDRDSLYMSQCVITDDGEIKARRRKIKPTHMERTVFGDSCRNLSRTYAIESSAFVLHTTTVISEKGLTAMRTGSGSLFNTPGGGASAVYGPDGRQLTKDMSETEEGIIYADLETEK
ncbi:hypothetical protein BGZ75_010128, partial [Mortierella antarctica]